MREPQWIRADVVRAIHLRQTAEHGGPAEVRDDGLLAAALDRPKNRFAYEPMDADLPALAAAYAFGITRDHPFVDGNKRTAYVVCRTFLLLTGFDITANAEEKYATFMRLAAGEMTEADLAQWIRKRLQEAH